MKQEFFVWAHTSRVPFIGDITNRLAAAGFSCRVQNQEGDQPDPRHWNSIQLCADAEDIPQTCLIRATIPSEGEVDELAEHYEDLPLQAKNAARKYVVSAESDEYGQATLFQLRIVAAIAQVTHGVIEDQQESGLMLPGEFEEFIAST